DTVQSFYDITRSELRDYELSILSKDREMEMMEDNHRVEVKVYEQKVKHLEYEHRQGMGRVSDAEASRLEEEGKEHMTREAELREAKRELRRRLRERERANETEVEDLTSRHEKALSLAKRDLATQLDGLRTQYETRLSSVRSELRLRHKVEAHEVEERRNQHIRDLMANHARDFGKVKDFFNGITDDNLRTIRELKGRIAGLQEKQVASQALMVDISEENKRLANPLTQATDEVLALRADLKDSEKDRLALRNARSRLRRLDSELAVTRRRKRTVERAFASLEDERDRLYDGFEETVRAVQGRAEYRNSALDEKLAALQAEFESKSAMLDAAMRGAQFDPRMVAAVGAHIDTALESKAAEARRLQMAVAQVSKAHNDAVRALRARSSELGVEVDDIDAPLLPAATSVGPAGLVARAATDH
ncbi:DRC4, partial [Symbiodinium sp. KB8]